MQSDELLLQEANQIKINVITKLILSYIAHKIKFEFLYRETKLNKNVIHQHYFIDIKSIT